jgi:YHS domain-containing protein
LAQLKDATNLRRLFVWQTQVTEEGVAALQQALPELQVDIGNYAAAPVAQATDIINENCPVSGQPVKADFTAVYQSQTIGFCCGDCQKKFAGKPAEFIKKVPEFKAEASEEPVAAKPINTKCPFNGKDINPEAVTTYQDKVIAFCCNNCKGKFEADPAAHIGKVAEFKE